MQKFEALTLVDHEATENSDDKSESELDSPQAKDNNINNTLSLNVTASTRFGMHGSMRLS